MLPPRSPRLNHTHREEFYQVIPDNWNVAHLNPQFQRWEHSYNTMRPHQAQMFHYNPSHKCFGVAKVLEKAAI